MLIEFPRDMPRFFQYEVAKWEHIVSSGRSNSIYNDILGLRLSDHWNYKKKYTTNIPVDDTCYTLAQRINNIYYVIYTLPKVLVNLETNKLFDIEVRYTSIGIYKQLLLYHDTSTHKKQKLSLRNSTTSYKMLDINPS